MTKLPYKTEFKHAAVTMTFTHDELKLYETVIVLKTLTEEKVTGKLEINLSEGGITKVFLNKEMK